MIRTEPKQEAVNTPWETYWVLGASLMITGTALILVPTPFAALYGHDSLNAIASC
jgi:hypothetical protein